MSDGHDHDHDDDHGADAHHEHFDGEPAKELGPDEPHTPGWLPLVGAVVFVVGAVFFVTQGEATPPSTGVGTDRGEGAKPTTQQTVAAPQQARPPQPIQAQPRPVPAGQPQPPGAQPMKQLDPNFVKERLQQRVQEEKQKQQQGGGAK